MESITYPVFSDRFNIIIDSLSNCKINYMREKDECKRIRELNSKLEMELKEAQELEKSHRYHLLNSREMIGNLQETVSELIYLRRDIKKLKEEYANKDIIISSLEKEKQNNAAIHKQNISELRSSYEDKIDEIINTHEKNIQQVQHDSDTQIAQFTCVIEELRAKIKEMESEHKDKMNRVVLEYEEKLQRSSAQITQLHDQHAGLVARTDANIDAYRRRLEDLEEKLKQSQFKQYLAQSMPSQYESQVERPYSVNRDNADTCSVDLDPVLDNPKFKPPPKPAGPNTLQITYYRNNKTPNLKNDKKKSFNIVKKRKLYNDKDFQDF